MVKHVHVPVPVAVEPMDINRIQRGILKARPNKNGKKRLAKDGNAIVSPAEVEFVLVHTTLPIAQAITWGIFDGK